MIIITTFILLLGVAYWVLKPGKRHKPQTACHKRPVLRAGKYHAVSINPGSCGCSAVKAVGEKRFLTTGTVPNLPLADCNRATCGCRYVRHEDRRGSQGNRRAIFSIQTDLYGLDGENDRRQRRGRRASDHLEQVYAGSTDYAEIHWNT
jgi:hypothetical protein